MSMCPAGLARWPKWGHLKELHRSIKLCEQALLNGEQTVLSLGPSQEVNSSPFGLSSAADSMCIS